MFSFKKLTASDVIVSPYYANKDWLFYSGSLPSEIQVFQGQNSPYVSNGNTTADGVNQSLVYDSINHLFYQKYSDSNRYLDTGSNSRSWNYISASSNRPTGSYTIYNDNPGFVNAFPTGAFDTIQVLSVSKTIYGSRLLPNNFFISTSFYTVKDDGLGNIITGSFQIGNIFYSQGLVVITDQAYQDIFKGGTVGQNILIDGDFTPIIDGADGSTIFVI